MVTIIMPVYNGEKYIQEAINSIINQTYSNWELVIVDDGSTDNTASIIKKFDDSRIKYVYQKNQGPSAARNKGIGLAEGNYIAFIDADDMYVKDKLEKQVAYLEETPAVDIVYNDIKVIDVSSRVLYTLKSEGIYQNREDFLSVLLFRQIIPLPPSILAKKKCFEKIRFNTKYVHGEDYDLTIRLAQENKYGYLKESLYLYRRHENNLTNDHNKQLQAEIKVVKNLGYEKIEEIVNASHFKEKQKQFLLGKIYIKIEEYGRAKSTFYQLYEKGLRHSLLLFYLGNCHYLLNELDEAKQLYKEAINQEERPEFYNNVGCVYGIKGELEKANSFFYKALKRKKGYMDANYNIEQLKKSQPKFKITVRELRETLTHYNIN